MKKNIVLTVISALTLAVVLTGCGGGGEVGQPGSTGSIPTVITATVFPGTGLGLLAGSEGATVDAYQTPKCPVGSTYADQPEPFRIHQAELSITATPIADDPAVTGDSMILENYKIEFFPQTPGAPPIAEFHGVFQTVTIPNNKTEAKMAVPLVDIDRKLQFVKDMESGTYHPDSVSPLYVAKYTLFGKDIHGNAFSVVATTSFWIGDYYYCNSTVTGGAK